MSRPADPRNPLAPIAALARRWWRGEHWSEHIERIVGARPVVPTTERADVQAPTDGEGTLDRRRYRVGITDPQLDAIALIDTFCGDPNRFSPTDYAVFTPEPPERGWHEGDEATVALPGPWDGPVRVAGRTDTSLRFETLEGHMEAGTIEFRAADTGAGIVFEIESIARSGDPAFEVLYHRLRIARLVQTDMWVRVLEAAVGASGGRQVGRILVDTTIYESEDT